MSTTRRDDSKPVVVVMTDEIAAKLKASATLLAFRVAARTGGKMQLTRAFKATVAGFNAEYGTRCRTWSDVYALLKAIGAER